MLFNEVVKKICDDTDDGPSVNQAEVTTEIKELSKRNVNIEMEDYNPNVDQLQLDKQIE